MSQIFTIFWTFLAAFFLFSITVIAHELGHLIIARRRGLVVERFSIGFGPTIFSKKWNGVEYVIKLLPFGGFVQLPQLAAMDMIEGEVSSDLKSIPPASPWAKMSAAFGGPLYSFLFAVILSFAVWWIGVPQDQNNLTTKIGYVQPNSPADRAGVKPGDRILAIDDQEVTRWMGRSGGVFETILLGVHPQVKLQVERDGKPLTFQLTPEKNAQMEGLRSVGFEMFSATKLMVDSTIKDSPAMRAGLQSKDEIIEINGQPVYSVAHIKSLIAASNGEVTLTYLRNGVQNTLSLLPEKPVNLNERLVGIVWNIEDIRIVHLTPLEQITNSFTLIYKTMRALVSPASGVGVRHLSGPVGIFDKLMTLLTTDVRLVLYFTVMLNVNLAVMNLLPLPILDGGHILYCWIEILRGRTISPEWVYRIQVFFFLVIISLFIFVTYHDVTRFGRRVKNNWQQSQEPPKEIEFKPPSTPSENPPSDSAPLNPAPSVP